MWECVGFFLLYLAISLGVLGIFGFDLDFMEKVKIFLSLTLFFGLLITGAFLLSGGVQNRMEYIYKEVNFTKYCPLCEEADTYEEKDPCNECLGFPMNEHSEKPVYFKPKKK